MRKRYDYYLTSNTDIDLDRWNIDSPSVQMVTSTANDSRVLNKDSVGDQKAAMEGLFVGKLISYLHSKSPECGSM